MYTRLPLFLCIILSVFFMLMGCVANPTPTPKPETRISVDFSEWMLRTTTLQTGPGLTAFFVTNQTTSTHELVVIRTDIPPDALPVTNGIVDEAKAGTVVGRIESSNLAPGKSAYRHWDLPPASYVLICNLPNHYDAGLRKKLNLGT